MITTLTQFLKKFGTHLSWEDSKLLQPNCTPSLEPNLAIIENYIGFCIMSLCKLIVKSNSLLAAMVTIKLTMRWYSLKNI